MQLNMWIFNTLLLNNGFLHDHPINQIVQICHWIKEINLLCGQSPTKWRTSLRWNPLAYSESTFKNENGFGPMWFINVLDIIRFGNWPSIPFSWATYLYIVTMVSMKKNIIENVLQMTLINFNWWFFMTGLGKFHVSHFNNTETL